MTEIFFQLFKILWESSSR